MNTKVEFLKKLPGRERLIEILGTRPEKFLVVYDKKLRKNPAIAEWLNGFVISYPVAGGEALKDLRNFPAHAKAIFKAITPFSPKSLCVVSLGGGSVGDFTGFLASVMKRGVPLVHIPTTLLAGMDSAHGGKTALNVGDIKNQIGTFYPAEAVLLVKSLFEGLPPVQLQSAGGELAKISMIEGGELYQNFAENFRLDLDSIWDFMPAVIKAKYKVVDLDPLEQSGERQILNLGHTLGHGLESYYGLPHGVAVGQGLIFALQWSQHQGYFRNPEPVIDLLVEKLRLLRPREFAKANRPMSRGKLTKYIYEDKKLTNARNLNFIFMEDIGRAFRKVVPLESFLVETQRQGWTSV